MSDYETIPLHHLQTMPPSLLSQNHAGEKLALLELIADSAPILVSYVDSQERYRFSNRAYESWFHHTREEVIGKTVREVVGVEVYTQIESYVKTALSGETVVYEHLSSYPDGARRHVRGTFVPDARQDGVVNGFVAYVEDITRRKEAEHQLIQAQADLEQRVAERTAELAQANEALQAQMEEINHIYQAAPVGLALMDQEYRFVRINERMAAINGPSVEDHIGHRLEEVLPDLADQILEYYRPVYEKGEPVLNVEIHGVTPADPEVERDWLANYIPYKSKSGEVQGLMVAAIDITRRKQAERELRDLQEKQAFILRTLPVAFYRSLASEDFRAVWVSEGIEGITGFPNTRFMEDPRFWVTRLHPDEREQVLAQADKTEEEGGFHAEYRLLRADNTYGWIIDQAIVVRDEAGQAREIIGCWLDITERKRLEEQLNQAQKMEGIGRLAGGIAHDFNNLLTAIIGYAELVADKHPTVTTLHSDLEQIRKAGARAAELTAQLLAFARKQMIHPRPINLNELVLNMDRLLRRLIGEDIELVTLPAPELATVLVDPGQFEQILVNLAVNARDAMPTGGSLTIETANVFLDAEYAQHHADVTPGPYVLLAMSDTGVGIPLDLRDRIFEPFFTTKEVGKGTGLGLATCYGIVKQAGGHIWVYSEPGSGTTFKIYLPCLEQQADSLPQTEIPAPAATGQETILLVEDEPMVREMAVQTLQAQGYRVLTASNGAEALEQARQYPAAIHLLVTDVVLPGMNGRQVAAQLSAEHPEIRVLYVSGYTENAVVHHGVLDAGVSFLAKPFTPSTLSRKVRETLGKTDD